MKIGGIQKVSLIDYPGKVAAVVFTQGCNFRCPYCHNPELVNPRLFRETIPEETVLAFLMTRLGKLDAVSVTGGEPTLQEGLPSFLQQIKDMGFLVKVDTNGSFPAVIEILLKKELVDFLAMDLKGPLNKYEPLVHVRVNTEAVRESIALITGSGINHEFRTTLVSSMLTGEDIETIAGLIPSARKYVLQRYIPSKPLDINFLNETTFGDEEIVAVKNQLEKKLSSVSIR